MAKHFVRTVNIRGVFGDRWLLRLEKRAFGWHYYGSDVTDEVGYTVTETSSGFKGETTHSYIDWLEFRRQNPYSSNLLFVIAEFFSKIWSFMRRLALVIGTPLTVIALVVGLLDKFACDSSWGIGEPSLELFKMGMIFYFAGLVLPTFIFSLTGFLLRKIFRIDEKVRASLRYDGYDDDLNDCSIDGE